MEYHLRVDIEESKSSQFTNLFLEKFKPDLYCVSFEIAKITKKPHIHMYLKFSLDNVPPKSTVSDFMKKEGFTRKYGFSKQKKSTLNHLLYILKDLSPIMSNLPPELLEELIEKCENIKVDKKRTLKEKFYLYWLDNISKDVIITDTSENIIISGREDNHIITSDFYIFNIIMEYVYLNDLLPPNKSQMLQYIQYIKLQIINIHTESIKNTNVHKKHLIYTTASSYGIFIPDDVRKNITKNDKYFNL